MYKPIPSGPFVCPVLEEFCCVRARSGSTCESPLLAADNPLPNTVSTASTAKQLAQLAQPTKPAKPAQQAQLAHQYWKSYDVLSPGSAQQAWLTRLAHQAQQARLARLAHQAQQARLARLAQLAELARVALLKCLAAMRWLKFCRAVSRTRLDLEAACTQRGTLSPAWRVRKARRPMGAQH